MVELRDRLSLETQQSREAALGLQRARQLLAEMNATTEDLMAGARAKDAELAAAGQRLQAEQGMQANLARERDALQREVHGLQQQLLQIGGQVRELGLEARLARESERQWREELDSVKRERYVRCVPLLDW